jgi:hypothetical protein
VGDVYAGDLQGVILSSPCRLGGRRPGKQ